MIDACDYMVQPFLVIERQKSISFSRFLEAASPSVGNKSYETTHHYLGLLSRPSQGIDVGLASRVLSRFSQEWKSCSRQTVEIPGDQSIE